MKNEMSEQESSGFRPNESWAKLLERGLRRRPAPDQMAGNEGYSAALPTLKWFLPFALKHRLQGLLGAGLLLTGTLLTLPYPLVYRYLIDDVLLARNLELLGWALLLLAALKISGLAVGTIQQLVFSRFEQLVLLDLQHALFERTLRLPKTFFDRHEVGYLMSRLSSDVQGIRFFFSRVLVRIVSSVLRLASGTVLLFYLEWRLALLALVVLPLMVVSIRYFGHRMRVLSHHGMEVQARVSRRIQETLASTPLIKAFASETEEANRVLDERRGAFNLSMESLAVGSLANLSLGLVGTGVRFAVLAIGAYFILIDRWTLGSLLAFQSYLGFVFGPAHFLAGTNLQLQSALASVERVSTLFDSEPEIEPGRGIACTGLEGRVEIENVSFSYGREAVLNDVSCVIEKGERIAIVGPSGVGKTTLISLILVFYRPQSGRILFDGVPAEDYDLASLRRRIGYVSQSSLLLAGTIEENLRYGNSEASDEAVRRAAQASGIHDFVTGLEDGYESRLGEGGVNLSEGQKQRLAIARALVLDPDILILDEPTSALDREKEKSVIESLPEQLRKKTLLVVTHRSSTLELADRILYLRDGRLSEAGSRDELLSEMLA